MDFSRKVILCDCFQRDVPGLFSLRPDTEALSRVMHHMDVSRDTSDDCSQWQVMYIFFFQGDVL